MGTDFQSWLRRPAALLLLLLTLVAIPMLREINKGELHLNVDETRHAMGGVFLYDFFRDLPLNWPLQYAYEYYGKYPAVSIGHWPPAFYVIEAAFFAVFGISVWVSRLAIVVFALVGALFWYKIVRCYARPELALASMVIYSCLPAILLYEKSTMLEIPVLALSLAAIYYWLRFLEDGRKIYLYGVAFLSSWALLTKQTAIFLLFLFLLDWLRRRRWDLLRDKHSYFALGLSLLLVVPWYWFAMLMHPQAIDQITGSYSLPDGPSLVSILTYYPLSLPGQLGLPLLGLAVLGILVAVVSRDNRIHMFLLVWIIACYLVYTPLSDKGPRVIMSWLLPFVFFAVYFVWRLFARWPRAGIAALVMLGVTYYAVALAFERPYVEGCEEAARFLAQQPDSDIVFYQGTLNGDFIFFVRKFDPQKRRLVVREKAIVALSQITDMGGKNPVMRKRQMLRTAEEVEQMFLDVGVRYMVVENRDFAPELALTHVALRSDKFELIKKIPIRTNDHRVKGIELLIYRNKVAAAATQDELVIPMFTLPQDLRLSLSRLAGQPWPPRNPALP